MKITFDVDRIRREMKPIDFESAPEPSLAEQKYFRFYHIDLENQLDGIGHRFGKFNAAGYDIAVHHFFPRKSESRGVIFVLHGYHDHVGLYHHIIRYCLERQYSVIAYDLPGHGLSSGELGVIHEFEHYVDVLDACLGLAKKHLNEPIHVIAQSTGGAIVMDYVINQRFTKENCPFEKIILLAPLIRPRDWGRGKFLYNALKFFVRKINRVFTENSHDFDFLDFLRHKDPLQNRDLPLRWVGAMARWIELFEFAPGSSLSPVVIQGQQDGTVDWRHNIPVIMGKFDRPQVHYLPRGRHHLANEEISIRIKLLRLFDQYLN